MIGVRSELDQVFVNPTNVSGSGYDLLTEVASLVEADGVLVSGFQDYDVLVHVDPVSWVSCFKPQNFKRISPNGRDSLEKKALPNSLRLVIWNYHIVSGLTGSVTISNHA